MLPPSYCSLTCSDAGLSDHVCGRYSDVAQAAAIITSQHWQHSAKPHLGAYMVLCTSAMTMGRMYLKSVYVIT